MHGELQSVLQGKKGVYLWPYPSLYLMLEQCFSANHFITFDCTPLIHAFASSTNSCQLIFTQAVIINICRMNSGLS